MSEHGKSIEPKIRRVQEHFGKLASEKLTEQLLVIIHRPGWTTPAESQLVHAALDSLTHQLEGFDRTLRTLVAGADQVGKT
jgi:hypothetical protein